MNFKGKHWTQMPNADEIRKRMIESKKKSPKTKIASMMGVKARLEKYDGTSWNNGLPKEEQPRYGKPISEKQWEELRKGREETPHTKPWNTGIKEWSPRLAFKRIRQQALINAQNKCENCKSQEKLVVHHKQHWEQLKDWNLIHSLENLEVLCRTCHVKKHWEQRKQLIKK